MKAGEKLSVRVRGTRLDGSAHHDGAVAAFYGPCRDDPERVWREPDRTAALAFDPVTRLYGADIRTSGWQPGDWTCRGTVLGSDGVPEGWGWFRFPLEA